MSFKRPPLINGELYHVVTRGVGDSVIFHDTDDYYRGIFSLYEFNTTDPVVIRERRIQRKIAKKMRTPPTDTRNHLVEILAFTFMSNHIHLLLKQLKDGGITQFMRKSGTGYAYYINKKYNRKGHLFQGRFKAVHVATQEQLRHVFVYIHTNPISLIELKWKERGIRRPNEAINFMENYKWSSYQDYLGRHNFTSVTNRDFMLKIMGGPDGCRKAVENWIRYKGEVAALGDMALE